MEREARSAQTLCSRRSVLWKAVVTTAGAAVLGTVVSRPAAAKAPQKLVGYQDTPHGAQQCDNCSQFEPPSSCKVVEGTISASGWCKVYVKKPAS
jgi:hypothetical protein